MFSLFVNYNCTTCKGISVDKSFKNRAYLQAYLLKIFAKIWVYIFIKSFSNELEITKNFTKKHFYRSFFILFFLIVLQGAGSAVPAMAQLPNKAFEFRRPLVPADSQRVKLGVYFLGFNKNNEYFNKITDGYTLFGMQAVPYLTYQASSRVRLDAGFLVRKDFGRSGFADFEPLLTIRYQQGPFNVLFGTLEGSLNHRLIEPLYDFERIMLDRFEEGLQFLLKKPSTFVDVWIDWEHMIYRGSSTQEEVSGGISFNQKLLGNEIWHMKLPLQGLAYHKGGQIDVNPNPLITRVNLAGGIELERRWEQGLIRSIGFQPYVVWFRDFSNQVVLPFQEGGGWYLNLSAASRHLTAMLSYWEGEEFVSIKGGGLYQSVSTTFKYPEFTQEKRKLLILRLLLEVPITKNLEVSTRFEPHYDFGFRKFEFSHGMYLNYKTDFYLFKVPSRKIRTP